MNQKKEKARQFLHAEGLVLPYSFPTSGCSGQASTLAADPTVGKNKANKIIQCFNWLISMNRKYINANIESRACKSRYRGSNILQQINTIFFTNIFSEMKAFAAPCVERTCIYINRLDQCISRYKRLFQCSDKIVIICRAEKVGN